MFKVKKEKCNECLYSERKIVSDERRAEIIKSLSSNDAHFICHKPSINGEDACCRVFFDTSSTNMIRIAGRLNMIEYVS